jgi:hypothetical protein
MIGNFFSSSITNVAFARKFIKHFAKKDNWHNFDIKKGNLGYGLVHYSLIRLTKPKKILCIGSRYGFIPAICALACKDNQMGQVDFVDAGFDLDNPDDKSKHWGGTGFWKKNNPEEHFGKFALNNYIETHIMTTSDFKKKFPQRKWSYIHLDGDHSYQGVKKDFNSFWNSLNRGCFLAFHDIHTQSDENFEYGVNKFWRQLKKKHSTFEFDGKYGLGILQKNDEN